MRYETSIVHSAEQRAANKLANCRDEQKIAALKPIVAGQRHVPVCCGDKAGNRVTRLVPFAVALAFGLL